MEEQEREVRKQRETMRRESLPSAKPSNPSLERGADQAGSAPHLRSWPPPHMSATPCPAARRSGLCQVGVSVTVPGETPPGAHMVGGREGGSLG